MADKTEGIYFILSLGQVRLLLEGGGLEPERGGSFIKTASLRGGSRLSLKVYPGEGHPYFKFHPINFKNII